MSIQIEPALPSEAIPPMTEMIHMPGDVASKCCDCGAISNSLTQCWACASRNVMALHTVLDRVPDPNPTCFTGEAGEYEMKLRRQQ